MKFGEMIIYTQVMVPFDFRNDPDKIQDLRSRKAFLTKKCMDFIEIRREYS